MPAFLLARLLFWLSSAITITSCRESRRGTGRFSYADGKTERQRKEGGKAARRSNHRWGVSAAWTKQAPFFFRVFRMLACLRAVLLIAWRAELFTSIRRGLNISNKQNETNQRQALLAFLASLVCSPCRAVACLLAGWRPLSSDVA